ncbi:MAG: hypothetical protein AAF387_13430 [Pseudomonadota bacterium]
MFKLSVYLLLAAISSLTSADETGPILDAPENAYWHSETQSWFVSNLGGGLSLARDGIGWVTRFDESGAVTSPRWVDGLDAPTGMAAFGGNLFVVDRGRVHQIEISTARRVREIELPGSEFANDAASTSQGEVFVSDTATNRIYLIGNGKAEVWLESDDLQSPNGLWVAGNKLLVATWGPMTDITTFATKHPGTLLQIDLKTKIIKPIGKGEPIANFDGIVSVGDYYYATDWTRGRLLRITDNGEVTPVLEGFEQLADLGYNPGTNQLGLPVMKDNRFILLTLD